MINIELQIKGRDLTPEQEAGLCTALRQAALDYVFRVADSFGATQGLQLSHRNVGVTGDVTIK